MKNVYLVRGFRGEYSDLQEWVVCAYEDKSEATAHAARAGCRAKVIRTLGDDMYSAKNEHDPHFVTSYTGTEYSIEEVMLWERGDTQEQQGGAS